MKLNFVLPPNDNTPIGGYKVVFQYANELVNRGHDVTISFMTTNYPDKYSKLVQLLGRIKFSILDRTTKYNVSWFKLDDRVKLKYNCVFERDFDNADVVIATAVHTAKIVLNLPERCGTKYYFIQAVEDWSFTNEQIDKTYKYPLKKIAISKGICERINSVTDDSVSIVPNFIDDHVYYLNNKLTNRSNIISILYHQGPQKNFPFGLSVLKKVKSEIPNLRVKIFGVYDEPNNLPSWCKYYKRPSQSKLRDEVYGSSKIFLLPSINEGWGLTGMEAMASGATLVASDIDGIREYATNDENSALVEMNNIESFTKKIVLLMNDDDERMFLAKNAIKDIRAFSLTNSTNTLLRILRQNAINNEK